MTTPTTHRSAPGFLLALALGLTIAIGGLFMLDRGNVSAANDGPMVAASALPDAEACSTHGSHAPGTYYPVIADGTNPTAIAATYPTYTYPGYVNPYGGYYGYYGYGYYGPYAPSPVLPVVVGPAQLPVYGEPYLSPTHVNYACNAFNNCDSVGSYGVVCPGNPAGITLNSSLTSATCGSATNIDAKVVGPSGMIVADGTPVLFTTSLGMVPDQSDTDGGIVSVSLVFPPKTTGTANVVVTAGTAKATATITVTC